LWHCAEAAAAQVPLYWVNPVRELRGDKLCSGSELPIANRVTWITLGTRKRCDPAFTASEPYPIPVPKVLGCA